MTSMDIVWNTEVPLYSTADTHLASSARHATLCQQIEETLQAITGLEDMRTPVADDASQAGQGLARVEFKLNLVLELLSELISQSQERPLPRPVKIGARQVCWMGSADHPPVVGDAGILELYVHPLYVRPLRLPGRVSSIEATGDGVQVTMELVELEPMAQEALERWIFLHHRRSVAHARPGKM